ncbi:hypothetical protein ABZV91_13085 [Nocardia sp. NPDC004568]|uniref:hypothetical protein n=1 Tax=Nocardia sp. NPDC004568 TaxID=3154551 RepID=UPI0033A47A33
MSDIDEAAQVAPEWAWSIPGASRQLSTRLFTDTLPGVPADWKSRTGSAKPIGPMPQGIDRYSDE